MNFGFFERIWYIQGSVSLPDGLTSDEAFERLDPMFKEPGTAYLRDQDTLTFTKKDQAAQDKMSIFDGGQLSVDDTGPHLALRYNLKSRALLTCFLAPLVFLAFAQLATGLNILHDASASVERSADEAEDAEEEEAEEIKLHPIDKFLGAPAPKQPGEEDEDSADEEARTEGGDGDETEDEEEEKKKHSSRPAYVFAGIFALIYLVGRVLESWLIKRRFTAMLQESKVTAVTD